MNVGHRNKWWEIDSLGNCGSVFFPKVVVVYEPRSEEPRIKIPNPFRLKGVKKAITLIEKERARLGLTTSE